MQIPVTQFISEVKTALQINFNFFQVQVLFQTAKSLKLRIDLKKKVFIAIRFNARNGRMDFALIKEEKRIFGSDNLKSWHVHPLEAPDSHLPCKEPTINKMIADIKKAFDVMT